MGVALVVAGVMSALSVALAAPHTPVLGGRPLSPQNALHPAAPSLPVLPALPALPSLPNLGGASFLPNKIMPPINAPAPMMDRGYSLTTSMLAAMTYVRPAPQARGPRCCPQKPTRLPAPQGENIDDFLEPYAWTAMLTGLI